MSCPNAAQSSTELGWSIGPAPSGARRSSGCNCLNLLARLSPIVVLTQHLAVRRVRLAPLVPGFDVIALHFLQLKLLLALDADALLPLVCLPPHVVGERADVQ